MTFRLFINAAVEVCFLFQSHAALLGMDDAKFGFIEVKYLEQIKGPLKRCQSLIYVEFYLILEVDLMGVPFV